MVIGLPVAALALVVAAATGGTLAGRGSGTAASVVSAGPESGPLNRLDSNLLDDPQLGATLGPTLAAVAAVDASASVGQAEPPPGQSDQPEPPINRRSRYRVVL